MLVVAPALPSATASRGVYKPERYTLNRITPHHELPLPTTPHPRRYTALV